MCCIFFQEFLVVEMINVKIQFFWNVGVGVGSVISDFFIQSEVNFINIIDKWYYVKVDRLGDYLLVKKYFFVDFSLMVKFMFF